MLSVFGAVVSFISGTLLLRQVIYCFEGLFSYNELIVYVAIVLAIKLLYTLLEEYWTYNKQKAVFEPQTISSIQKELYIIASKVDLKYYDTPEYYDNYLKAMTGAGEMAIDVLESIAQFVSATFMMIANIFIVLKISPVFAVFFIVPIASIFFNNKENKINYAFSVSTKNVNKSDQYVQKVFSQRNFAKDLRMTQIWRVMFLRQKKAFEEYKSKLKSKSKKILIIELAKNSIEQINIAVSLIYSICNTPKLWSIGDCLVILNSIGAISQSLSSFAGSISSFHNKSLYIEDYLSFKELVPSQNSVGLNGLKATKGEIQFINVYFRYPNTEEYVLENVNLTISTNEKITLVGSNGAGKTTLIKLLLRLYEPTSGEILLNGVPITRYSIDTYRALFSVVLQSTPEIAATVAENILLKPIEINDRSKLDKALSESGALNILNKNNTNVDAIMTKEYSSEGVVFSQGEFQALNLARPFFEETGFVVLDEPSSSLDPIAEYEMLMKMVAISNERSMVFVSHRLSMATLADKIVVLKEGKICEIGKHSELMRQNGIYAKMFNLQAQGYKEGAVQ